MSLIQYRQSRSDYTTVTVTVVSVISSPVYEITVDNASLVRIGYSLIEVGQPTQTVTNVVGNVITLNDPPQTITIGAGDTIELSAESVKAFPLDNDEIDNNFQELNKTKIENDGSIDIDGNQTITGDLTVGGSNINIDGGGIQIGSSSDIISIPGTLNVTNQNTTTSSTTASLAFIAAQGSTSAAQADGGGLKVGDSTTYASFLFDSTNTRWNTNIDLNINGEVTANNYISTAVYSEKNFISDGEPLETSLDNIDQRFYDETLFTGSDQNITTIFTDQNYVSNGDSLKTAIDKLDLQALVSTTDITTLNDWTGITSGSPSTNFSIENIVSNGDDLLTAVDKLDVNLLYSLSQFSEKSSNFIAESTYTYYVTPAAQSTVDATLPLSQRGTVAFRLEDASNSRRLAISGGGGDIIEDNNPNDRIILDVQNLTITFMWDNNLNIWRIHNG